MIVNCRIIDIDDFQMEKLQLIQGELYTGNTCIIPLYEKKPFGVSSNELSISYGITKENVCGFYLFGKTYEIIKKIDDFIRVRVENYKSMLICNYLEGETMKLMPTDMFEAKPIFMFPELKCDKDGRKRVAVKVSMQGEFSCF